MKKVLMGLGYRGRVGVNYYHLFDGLPELFEWIKNNKKQAQEELETFYTHVTLVELNQNGSKSLGKKLIKKVKDAIHGEGNHL